MLAQSVNLWFIFTREPTAHDLDWKLVRRMGTCAVSRLPVPILARRSTHPLPLNTTPPPRHPSLLLPQPVLVQALNVLAMAVPMCLPRSYWRHRTVLLPLLRLLPFLPPSVRRTGVSPRAHGQRWPALP